MDKNQEWMSEAHEQYLKYVLPKQVNQNNQQSLSTEQLALINKLAIDATLIICKNQKIPAGFVIVQQTTNFSCSYEINNAWMIKRPGDEEVICKESPIPDEYVIVRQETNFSCSTEIQNAWLIKIPEEREIVCKASPIPKNYVIIAQTTDFGCSAEINNAWVIVRISEEPC